MTNYLSSTTYSVGAYSIDEKEKEWEWLEKESKDYVSEVFETLQSLNIYSQELEQLVLDFLNSARLVTKELKISKTGEGELVIHWEQHGEINNIIIDEEGDVEVLIIPRGKLKSKNSIFYHDENHQVEEILDLFDGL